MSPKNPSEALSRKLQTTFFYKIFHGFLNKDQLENVFKNCSVDGLFKPEQKGCNTLKFFGYIQFRIF